ncbi:unnamed protein product [Orchesella dallaii]|uniref:Uncharacterized protein n=1 Tax=Orchesella dallaii TaxID=48710 RepID=A0ABP1QIH5_9HEXA
MIVLKSSVLLVTAAVYLTIFTYGLAPPDLQIEDRNYEEWVSKAKGKDLHVVIPEGDSSIPNVDEVMELEPETIGEEMYLRARGYLIKMVKYFVEDLAEFMSNTLLDTFLHLQNWVKFAIFGFMCLFAYFIHRLLAVQRLEEEIASLKRDLQTAHLLVIKTVRDAKQEVALLDEEIVLLNEFRKAIEAERNDYCRRFNQLISDKIIYRVDCEY